MSTAEPTLRTYLVVYAALLVGLVLTVAVSYAPLGYGNLPVAMTIALAKASLVVLIFMHVRYSPRLTWIAVFAGLVWLAILLTLTIADYATRDWLPTKAPVQMALPN